MTGRPSPLRVCHVIHDLRRGGAEHLLLELAELAPAVGLEMTVLSLMAEGSGAVAGSLKAAGVEVGTLGLRTRWDPRAARRAVRILRRWRPDVVHTHLRHADIVGASAANRLGIPMVSTLHVLDDARGPVGRLKRWAAVRARGKAATRTIAVSDAVRRWYLESHRADPTTVVTIRNGIADRRSEPAHRDEVRDEWGVGEDQVLVVMVAIMRPGKGHDDVVEAAALLPGGSPVVFALVGLGPEHDRLLARAGELGVLGERVLFPGFRQDVDRVLAGADIVVQPSSADALPTALIHALAAGKPIVATRVGGIPEIVGDQAGTLVDSGDAEILAREVSRLAEDPATLRLMGKRARERFEGEFDGRLWVARLRTLYEEVLGLGPNRRS